MPAVAVFGAPPYGGSSVRRFKPSSSIIQERRMSYTKGFNSFYTVPGEVESMNCKVCGAVCEVKRSVFGATSWAEAAAKSGHVHDHFYCPHSGRRWHEQALELVEQMVLSPSKRLRELMWQDLLDLLKENGIDTVPELPK
jgi:hypothetical protein